MCHGFSRHRVHVQCAHFDEQLPKLVERADADGGLTGHVHRSTHNRVEHPLRQQDATGTRVLYLDAADLIATSMGLNNDFTSS